MPAPFESAVSDCQRGCRVIDTTCAKAMLSNATKHRHSSPSQAFKFTTHMETVDLRRLMTHSFPAVKDHASFRNIWLTTVFVQFDLFVFQVIRE